MHHAWRPSSAQLTNEWRVRLQEWHGRSAAQPRSRHVTPLTHACTAARPKTHHEERTAGWRTQLAQEQPPCFCTSCAGKNGEHAQATGGGVAAHTSAYRAGGLREVSSRVANRALRRLNRRSSTTS